MRTVPHETMAALVVSAFLAIGGGPTASSASQSLGSRVLAPEPPFAVGSDTVTLVDPTRGTPAWSDVPASSSRTIETLVLFPARGEPAEAAVAGASPVRRGRFPVVVFLHGSGTTGADYQAAVEPWAEAGYVVVAPTAPLGELGLQQSGAARVADLASHPDDVRFVLTNLRGALDPAVRAIADFRRVAITGKSLGAGTALSVAFDPCCSRKAIRGVVAMAGRESPLVAAGRKLPTLIVHSDADELIPYSSGRANFDAAQEPKFLLTLLGATHAGTLAPNPPSPTDDALVATAIDFFDRYLKSDTSALERLARHGNVTGIARLE